MAQTANTADRAPDLSPTDPDLGLLKRLLLNDERRELGTLKADLARLERSLGSEDHRQLSALREDLSRIEGLFGSEERFLRAMASSLIGAMRVAEAESHRDLAAAMAPLVVSSIRREIEQSRDTMVETLYPITGRMVAAAVAAMFRQLSDDINQKIEASLSPALFHLRVKAVVTRRPLSALILAEAARGRLQRLVFIERATGAVLATTGPGGLPEPEPADTLHLLGGLVSAIVEFAGHALSDVQGELRQLDFGGQTVFLRASPLCVVAAITGSGRLVPGLSGFIDDAFLNFLDDLRLNGADGSVTVLSGLHRDIDGRIAPAVRKKRRVSPLTVIAALFMLGCGYWTVEAVSHARERSREDARLAAIATAPALQSYPVHLAFDRAAGVIRAEGIVSTRAAAEALAGELARGFPVWPVASRIAILSETLPADAALRERLVTVAEEVRRQAAANADELGALHRQVAATEAGTERTERGVAAVRERISTLDGPLQHLEAVVRGTSIFFDVDGDHYRDAAEARRALEAVAEALKATTARLRIVGTGDGSGTPQANLIAARMRAEKVSADLQALGIAPARLATVSTRPFAPLDDQPRSGINRRVVFELAYPSE